MAILPADLKKYSYFSGLSDESLDTLAKKFTTMTVPRGTEVIKEGDQADLFYFVKQGRLEVTKNTKHGTAKMSIIGSGQGFGELALITCAQRSANVRAVNETVLYQLPKADFEALMQREPQFRSVLHKRASDIGQYDRIKTLQPFALLEPDRMYALLARMTERTYAFGEDIIVQGEKGDNYYVVKSGRVAVLKKAKGDTVFKQVVVLAEGDGFGEEALIRDDPRNATCRAIEDTTVYCLDKNDFDQILKAAFLDNMFAEDISIKTYREKYVIIDARVPPEYAQEHIEGALSIPVEILRHQYAELDPAKVYITYCTNDSRGMVAAFLLKNHGFNAKCLRGGLSSWEGPTARGPEPSAQ